MQFEGLMSRAYMIFGTGNPNLMSILKPEVELMVLLRMRSNKKHVKRLKMSLKYSFKA